ncbi:unnamed protein product [Allacma fusca]|uniref:Uncharacterized protein n=1 Tax=Allacma fusca TaxID=39272 RepID=A0A8J2KX05_9HEXA|nr:unnamed protein product [Allacma fusca]
MRIFKDTCLRCLRRSNYVSYLLVSSVIVVIYIKTTKYSDEGLEHAQDFFSKQREKELDKQSKNKNEVEQYLKFYNQMGHAWTNLQTFEAALQIQDKSFKKLILSRSFRAREIYRKLIESGSSNSSGNLLSGGAGEKVRINVATVACSKSTIDVMVMLKSAVMFSRDASLHVIIFGDKTLPLLAELVLELKWTINSLGWDFTYELLEVWFPPEQNEEWKQMYALCATQRLFFTSLLPHIDSLIYLDADSIVVSNLTNFWNQFQRMNESQLAGIAPNTEFPANGFYNLWSTIPYFGKRG